MTNFGEQVDESPFAARGFLLSAMFLGVIALVGLLVITISFIGGDDEDEEASAPVAPTASPTDEDSPADGESSVCGLTEVELAGGLDEPPGGAEWELVGTIAAPEVEGHGPGRIDDDGYRSCFARTPLGAVLAAANWSAMGSDPELAEMFMEQALAEGPGREAALENAGSSAAQDDDGASIQIAAFRVVSYDGEEAAVQIVYTSSYGLDMVFPFDLRWEDGDWKYVVADDGEPVNPPYPVESLSSFVRWQGA
ncbi:hypothetical protein IDM40_04395 [Nocardiopsis sp. HNM0947]|uniref:DUF8175 domain-containing protein n=1 Tax=Nocardiopsis coralli TaxID=2772213 RepID=A0ABR9P292_9ACTN|nr:hypothetical protein [Nocardiopsis coralli]MBE2997952.1 hypothetical protein [Nocardiopsis coralli]